MSSGNATHVHASHEGMTVFLDRRPARRGETYRSHMQSGIWLGIIAAANLETEEPVFGRRRWTGSTVTAFWAPSEMPSDHFVLADSSMASLFIHLDPDAQQRLDLDTARVSSWSGLTLSSGTFALRGILDQTRALLSAATPTRPHDILSFGRRVTASVLGETDLLPAELATDTTPLPTPDIDRVYLARDLLLADLRNPPTIVELARASGTNARKLTEQFRALFGMPPFAYLKHYRLEQAFDAVQRGDQPITAIAAEIGYRPTHLSAAFRARFGHSPRHYRTAM